MTAAARHEADLRLAHRIINEHLASFIAAGCATALAVGLDRRTVEQIQHLHLAGCDHKVTPRLVDALTRAGLLRGDA